MTALSVNEEIRISLITQIFRMMQDPDIEQELVDQGVSTDLLKILAELDEGQIRQLCGIMRLTSLEFDLDTVAVGAAVNQVLGNIDISLTFFLKRGASFSMIESMWKGKVTRAHIARYASQLGVSLAKPGRPQMPSLNLRDEIVTEWLQDGNLPMVERYIALANKFPKLTLATLHSVLTNYELEFLKANTATSA